LAALAHAQDRANYSPHITIQNKVAASEARNLLQDYRGGPWEPAAFA